MTLTGKLCTICAAFAFAGCTTPHNEDRRSSPEARKVIDSGEVENKEAIYAQIVELENAIGRIRIELDAHYTPETRDRLLSHDSLLVDHLQQFATIEKSGIPRSVAVDWLSRYGLSARTRPFFVRVLGEDLLVELVRSKVIKPTVYWKAYPAIMPTEERAPSTVITP